MGLRDRLIGREYDDVTPISTASSFPVQPRSPRPLTAAAQKIDLKDKSSLVQLRNRQAYTEWQKDAWGYYDAIGEIKYALNIAASILSRLRLYPAVNMDPDSAPSSTVSIKKREANSTAEEKAEQEKEGTKLPDGVTEEVMSYMDELVDALGSGYGGIPGLLRSFSLNMSIAGECYLCNIDKRWSFRSTDEITIRETDGKAVLQEVQTMQNVNPAFSGTNSSQRILDDKTFIGRIWKPHPRYSGEPDSSMLGLRELCDELLTLQRMIRATARSTGAENTCCTEPLWRTRPASKTTA